MEATQDVFLKVLRLGSLPDHPSSYLYRSATNVSLNRIRGKKRKPTEPLDPKVQLIADAPDDEGRTGAMMLLNRLFSREQESTRTIAVLHYVDGWTLEEVAAEVGLSLSGVRKRLRVLRTHLHGIEEGTWPA